MTPEQQEQQEQQEQLCYHVQAIAMILYEDTSDEKINTLEYITPQKKNGASR